MALKSFTVFAMLDSLQLEIRSKLQNSDQSSLIAGTGMKDLTRDLNFFIKSLYFSISYSAISLIIGKHCFLV